MEKGPKVKLTLAILVNNAKRVLGRDHLIDRKIKVNKILPSIGVKSIRFDGEAYGAKLYPVTIIFYDVNFSDKKDSKHTLLAVASTEVPPSYAEKPDMNKHPVRVYCGCEWFHFASEWYLAKAGSLMPARKPRSYVKAKGSTRKSVNPLQLPCCCKHLLQFALELENRGLVE